MRLASLRRRNIVLSAVAGLLLAGWLLGPALGLPIPSWVFIAAAFAVVAVNVGLNLWTFRAIGTDAARVVAAHSGSAAFPSAISVWPQVERSERDSVIAVVADRRGLSFRDREDREVRLVPAEHILSLELAPLDPRSRFRPIRVTTIDGVIDFSGPPQPDAQVDAIVALRTALGRAAT